MSKTTDGGPAFPVTRLDIPEMEGMSLRDWFAGMALQGMITNNTEVPELARKAPEQAAAIVAYNFADAMLRERAR